MENKKIEELKLRIDVEIIRPYLESKGFNLTPKHDYDIASYYVARQGDIRYLAFGIYRYNPDAFGLEDYELGDCGQVVYDVNGKVLLDCVDRRADLCSFLLGCKEHYEEIEPSDVFMDDYILISDHKHWLDPISKDRQVEGSECLYSIYKLEYDKYVLQSKHDREVESVLKTPSGELFLNKMGKLYSVRESRYLNDIEFKGLAGLTLASYIDTNIDRLLESTKEVIRAKLKNEDVILAYDYINDGLFGEFSNCATVFAFLDTTGNFVSKLYCRGELEFFTLDVDNDSYEQVIECCKKRLRSTLQKKYANERRRKTREMNKWAKDNANMLTTLMEDLSTESINAIKVKK